MTFGEIPDAHRHVPDQDGSEAWVVPSLQFDVGHDAVEDHLTDQSEQDLYEAEPNCAREQDRHEVEQPSHDVDKRNVVLIEQVAIGRAVATLG